MEASALIADPSRRRLYAVVAGNAKKHANELVVIDGERSVVEASILVGPDPDALALADDASTLWVGLHGAMSVRQVDLTQWPPKPGSQYSLPAQPPFFDAVYAKDMVVLPGRPDSVAISLHYDGVSPSFAGLVVIDAGKPRPNRTSGHTGSAQLTSGPLGHLFGFNNLHTEFGFYSIAVDEMGLTESGHAGLIAGFKSDIVYDGQYVFASSGEVIDVHNPEAPLRAGVFGFSGNVVPHAAQSKVLMLSQSDWSAPLLRELSMETFRQDREQVVDGEFGSITDFVEIKPGLYAFREFSKIGTMSFAKIHTVAVPAFAE